MPGDVKASYHAVPGLSRQGPLPSSTEFHEFFFDLCVGVEFAGKAGANSA